MSDERPVQEQETLPEWLERKAQPEPAAPVKQRVSTFTIVATALALGLLAIIGYALTQRDKASLVGKPAPDFTITTYDTDQMGAYSNTTMKLSSLKGKVVVLNVWASYCEPCQEEAEMLERVWRDLADNDVMFIGVANNDVESKSLEYLDYFDVTYPNAPDEGGEIYDEYGLEGIPETFIIAPDGKVTKHFISGMSERDLRSAIDKARNS